MVAERAEGVALGAAAFDSLEHAVVALDADGRMTYVNAAAEGMYDFSAEDVLGRDFGDVVICCRSRRPGGVSVRPSDVIGLADGRAVHVTESGRQIPVRVTLLPCAGGHSPHRHVAIIEDDREFQRLSESLNEQLRFERLLAGLSARFSELPEEEIDGEIELWLRRLIEFLGVDRGTFAEITPAGDVLVTHACACPGLQAHPRILVNKLLPWVAREVTAGRTVAISRVPEDLPPEAVEEREEARSNGMRSFLIIPVRVGGACVCALTFGSVRRERDWAGDLVSRLQTAGEAFANAMARKQAKQRLEHQRQELAHVGRVAAMGELASVIAHELDQPLTAVVTNAHAVRFLLDGGERDLAEADAALQEVVDAAMRVTEIVRRERRLLKKQGPGFAREDLNDVVRDVELFIRADAKRHGARLAFELLPGLPAIMADRVQVQQVVLNLTHNALQAMDGQPQEKRVLRIQTAAQSGEAVLSVADAGPAVDDSCLGRLFQPFFTTKSDGMGMGLSISRSIIDAHHGRIWAERNAGGEGLTLHVAIPIGKPPGADPHAEHGGR